MSDSYHDSAEDRLLAPLGSTGSKEPSPGSPAEGGCPECGYDVQPIESFTESGIYLGWTCQRCGWHPRGNPPLVLPEVEADLSDKRLRL